ncbi:MAG: hypothetical protein D6701_00020 [Gemmatimonadetes bacterium]|nr:MAG: hypothetical protein D6701_00020 [Gemmatimonadota bacterium]
MTELWIEDSDPDDVVDGASVVLLASRIVDEVPGETICGETPALYRVLEVLRLPYRRAQIPERVYVVSHEATFWTDPEEEDEDDPEFWVSPIVPSYRSEPLPEGPEPVILFLSTLDRLGDGGRPPMDRFALAARGSFEPGDRLDELRARIEDDGGHAQHEY